MLKRLFLGLPLVIGLFVGIIAAPVWAEEEAAKPDEATLERNAEEVLFATSKEQGAPKGAVTLANTFRRYLLAGNNKKVLALFAEEDQDYYHDRIMLMKKKDLQTQGLYFRKAKCASATDKSAVYNYRPNTKYKIGNLYMKFDGKKWWCTDWFQSTKYAK
ncbi:MAG TPA: hypothetical protein PKO06_07660 [Candidatus Ozemobacteraceae bacterium]|nr:hypothetical protein [Candidatus Ozemobacteraceae bacterium]